MTKVAAIQMASGPNVKANLAEVQKLLGIAVQQEARLVVLPENFAVMGMSEKDRVNAAESTEGGDIQQFLSDEARKNGIWIVGGTIRDETRSHRVGVAIVEIGRKNPHLGILGVGDFLRNQSESIGIGVKRIAEAIGLADR